MVNLLATVDVQHFACLTAIVSLLIALIVVSAWLFSRIAGERRIGLLHCIWVGALLSVALSPVFVGLVQFVPLPFTAATRALTLNVVSGFVSEKNASRSNDSMATDIKAAEPKSLFTEMPKERDEVSDISTSTFADAQLSDANGIILEHPEQGITSSSAALKPISTPAPRRTLLVILGVIWLGGIFIGVARLCIGWIRLRSIRRSSKLADNEFVIVVRRQVCERLGLCRPPQVLFVSDCTGPFTAGILSPAVYIPESLLGQEESLRGVLLHECSHIVYRHHWLGLVQRIASIIGWWHPAIHFLDVRLKSVMECLCDNTVVQSEDPSRYAALLLSLTRTFQNRMAAASLGMVHRPSTLEKRIFRILQPNNVISVPRLGLVTVVLVFFTILLLGIAVASPRDEPETLKTPLTFADEFDVQPTAPGVDAPQLLEAIPAGVVSYVRYQGAAGTVPARREDARWFFNWAEHHWGLSQQPVQLLLGMTLPQLFELADEREQICVCWDRASNQRHLLIAMNGQADSAESMLAQIVSLGFERTEATGAEDYYTCHQDTSGLKLFAAYRDGMYLLSDSEIILRRSLQGVAGELGTQLVHTPEHKAIANATHVGRRGARITWFHDIKAQRAAARPGERRRRRRAPSRDQQDAVEDALVALDQFGLFDPITAVGGTIEKPLRGDHQMVHHTMLWGRGLKGNHAFARLFGSNQKPMAVPPWLPSNAQSYACCSFSPTAGTELVETLMNTIAGEPGFFNDLLESLREDPNGPQVDVKEEFIRHLGTEFHVAKLVNNQNQSSVVFSIAIGDHLAVARFIDKVFQNDPSSNKHEVNGTNIWVFDEPDGEPSDLVNAVCVLDSNVVLATDRNTLIPIVANAERPDGHLLKDAKLFQRLSSELRALKPPGIGQILARSGYDLQPPFFLSPSETSHNSAWQRLRTLLEGNDAKGNPGPTALCVCNHDDGLTIHGLELRTDRDRALWAGDEGVQLLKDAPIQEITATECVLTAIEQSTEIGNFYQTRARNKDMLILELAAGTNGHDARSSLSMLIGDVLHAYWKLYFYERNVESAKEGRETALELWRRQAPGSQPEVLTREQYFFFRSRSEELTRDMLQANERLATRMTGRPANRLLRPSSAPDPKTLLQYSSELPFATAFRKARDADDRFHQQLVKTSSIIREASRQDVDSQVTAAQSDELLSLIEQVNAETNRLERMRIELRDRLTAAIQDFESTRTMSLTRYQRIAAATSEAEAMAEAFENGQVAIDRLLNAHRRKADTTIAYHQQMIECLLAKLNLDQITGALINEYVIEAE